MVKAGHQQEGYAETARYALTEAACTLLPVSSVTARDFTIGRRDEVIRLKDTEGRLTRYSDTPETRTMRANLRRLNDLLDGTDIALTRPAHPLADFDDKYAENRPLPRLQQRQFRPRRALLRRLVAVRQEIPAALHHHRRTAHRRS
jgi:hypothetical protein